MWYPCKKSPGLFSCHVSPLHYVSNAALIGLNQACIWRDPELVGSKPCLGSLVSADKSIRFSQTSPDILDRQASTSTLPRISNQSPPTSDFTLFPRKMPMMNYPRDSQSQTITRPVPMASTSSGYVSDDPLLTRDLPMAADVRTD